MNDLFLKGKKEMKRNNVLRTMAASLAAVCLISAASCSMPGQNGSDGSKGEKPKKTAAEVIKHSYRAEQFGSMPPIQYVSNMTRLGQTDNILVVGSDDQGETTMFLTDTNFENFKEITPDFNRPENSELYSYISAALDGTIFDVFTVTDYGDFKVPDWNDPDFDYDSFDWDAYQEAGEQTTYIYTFDSTGKELKHAEVNMDKFMDGAEDDMVTPYLGNITPIDSDHALAYVGGEKETYHIINSDGTFGNQINMPEDLWLGAFCSTPDGNIAFSSYSNDHECIGTINTADLKVNKESIIIDGIDNESISTLVTGDENYEYYACTYSTLYGIKSDGTAEELTTWLDSDLSGDSVRGMMNLGNNEFVIYVYDYSNNGANGFYRITERDASELSDKTLITIAVVYSDSNFQNEVNNFNRTSDKYRIKVNDYSKYYDWDEENEKYLNTPAKQFKLDLVAGNSPDMVFFSDLSAIKGLTNKGTFVDLYSFMEKDSSISKEDIIPSLLKACEEDGKLYTLTPSFNMSTAAVKTKLCDKENWTIDDLIETYKKLPAGAKLTQWESTKLNVFDFISRNMNFVDYKTGKCSYDSDEFVKLLEFANQFPEEEEEPDWEHMTEEDYQKYYEENETALRKDKALISTIDFYNLRAINEAKAATFGDDITLVGYPSTNGNGVMISPNSFFAILSDSPNKDECWSFMTKFFTEDYQKNNSWSIPALKSVFETKLEEAKEDPYYLDQSGKKTSYPSETTIGDQTIKIPNLSDEDVKYIRDFVYNANVSSMEIWDSDVSEIVSEEIKAYFAGEKTAKQTAEIIQNRVSIMISEQS